MTDKTKDTAADVLNNPFALFETDQSVEADGIELDYGAFYITVARAGGSNEGFKKALADKTRPYRRLIQEERMPEERSKQLLRETVAETVVRGWGSTKHGDGKMFGKNGEAIPFSVENVIDLFEKLPDLFQDVYEQAQKVSLFRANEAEADAGN